MSWFSKLYVVDKGAYIDDSERYNRESPSQLSIIVFQRQSVDLMDL